MRTLAAALLLVLASAGLGSANETAWVLWDEAWITSAKSGTRSGGRFEIIAGYGTAKECQAALVTWIAERDHYRHDENTVWQPLGSDLQPVIESGPGSKPVAAWNYVRLLCLPSSIDPRGPAR
jgi:hypothetical protein